MNLIQTIKNDKILNIISEEFDNDVFVVGGAVRDFVLNKSVLDRDLIVCDCHAKDFALKLADRFDAKFIPLDEENKIYRLVFPDKANFLDITNPVENSLRADLLRRDLTINAVAVNLKSFEVVDLVNGLEDLKNKKLNLISEKNFIDDPLRLLRVFRFYANTGFDITPELSAVVKKHARLIHKPAVERVNYEIMKMFSGEFVHQSLLLCDECGLLEELFPVVKELKLVPKNSHHHLDLFHHSVETVRNITEIYKNSDNAVREHLEKVDFGGFPRIAHLRLAGFLHDIGKYSTWMIEPDTGRHRFIKHDDAGAKLSLKLLKDLHFSNKQIDYISTLIKYHIYPSHVMCSPEITDKIMMRFVRRMNDSAIDNIILAKADRLSARGPLITDEIVVNNISSLSRLQDFYLNVKDSLKPLPKLLSGNDVMRELNIKPSPKLGEIMDALYEAQLNGDVMTCDDALKFIRKFR